MWVLVKNKEDLLMLSVKAKLHILFHARSRYAGPDTRFAKAEAVSFAILRRFGLVIPKGVTRA